MEVFSLLKYWKGGGGGVSGGCSNSSTASFATNDDGPFFDLEFADNDAGFYKLERENEVIQEADEAEEEGIKPGPFPKSDSPIRTARKLRVLMLRLKRSKSESISTMTSQTQTQNQHNNDNELLRVKFKAEVPIISLLSRATSNSKVNAEQQAHESCNEKRTNKRESVQKYFKKMKRQAEEAEAMTAAIKRLNLGKSESANNMASKRRDDSLLQQEDGIQSAILHCKRSFNASRDGE